jgi:hypothetical protein
VKRLPNFCHKRMRRPYLAFIPALWAAHGGASALGRTRAMKIDLVRLLIIIFVSLTLLASLFIPAGQPRYRLKERVQAMQAYNLNPSASTKAALDTEFARLHHHEATLGAILLTSVVIADAAVISFFWNYGRRKTTAQPVTAANAG